MRETSTTHGFGRVVIKTFIGLCIGIGAPNISAKPMKEFTYRSNGPFFSAKSPFHRTVAGANPAQMGTASTPCREPTSSHLDPNQPAPPSKEHFPPNSHQPLHFPFFKPGFPASSLIPGPYSLCVPSLALPYHTPIKAHLTACFAYWPRRPPAANSF